ncbi:hypothetical protein [Janibacter melonis]|uniref:hypothetical protein n=1 Tax=Janibacter melonis TaxID=262209 RepID=UPI00174C0105|nr:hypothetical protein [Janibacter melonis]
MHDIDRVFHVLDRHHVPELISGVICAGLVVLGTTMLATPGEYFSTRSFRVAFEWATPQAWGVTLIAACTTTLISLALRRRDVYWPITFVVLWLCAWCTALGRAVPDPNTVPSGTVVYTTLGLVLALIAISCAREGRHQP